MAQNQQQQQPQVSGLRGAARFRIERELADTLQGRIYAGTDLITGKEVVIKEAWRQLVHSGRSRKGHRVPEDFQKERELVMKLTNLPNCSEGIVRGLDQWDDEHCYYYAMEYCQGELFDHISKTHTTTEYRQFVESEANKEQIPMRKPNEWVNNVAKMFKQICNAVQFLHNHGYCHLDLSLENTMLSDVDNLKVKIIDFGLMQKFTGNNFNFYGRVGKLQYMCPEAYARQEYDAKAADVYCLGVMLFMMLIGAPPYQAPQPQNAAFNYFVSGRIGDVLKHWKRLRLITVDALDLLNKILRYQNTRITLDEILKHSFFDGIGDDGNKSQRSKPMINEENKENDSNFLSPVDQISEEISGMSLEDDPNNQPTKPVKQITNASDEGVDMQISDGEEDYDVVAYQQIQQQKKLQQQQQKQKQQQQLQHQPQHFNAENKENSDLNNNAPNGPGSGSGSGPGSGSGVNGNGNNNNTYCELLLNEWGLSEISTILHATGWSNPKDWHKIMEENILRWEVGLTAEQAQIFMAKYAEQYANNSNENKQNKQNAQMVNEHNTHQQNNYKGVKPPITQQMSVSPAPSGHNGDDNNKSQRTKPLPHNGQFNQSSHSQPYQPNNGINGQFQQHHNYNNNANQPPYNNNNINPNANPNMNANANANPNQSQWTQQQMEQYQRSYAQSQQAYQQYLAQQQQFQQQVQQYPQYNNHINQPHQPHQPHNSPSPQPAYAMPQPQMNVNVNNQYQMNAANQGQYNASSNNYSYQHDPNRHNNYKSAQH